MQKVTFNLALGLILLLCATNASAQRRYAGGSFTAFYSTHFDYSTHLHCGYEVNERWAAGGTLGVDLSTYSRYTTTSGIIGGYVRYTPWHNDILWLDIKCKAEMSLRKGGIGSADLGFTGGLRFRLSPHWDVYTDIACLGARYVYDYWSPLIGITGSGCSVGALYRF